uniref:Neurotransmitter-gated ion-channel ligand-binding domain-containing protein n=1 Tax=Anopheles stephensi TaxID=30069 RepID=A0A182Y633_ANOST
MLKKLLCSNYDKTERPVRNHNTTVNVTTQMFLKEYYVRQSEPSLYLSVWMSLSWMDEFLTWDRADYGMEMLNIDSSELWRPTIETLDSKPAGTLQKSCRDHQCELKHNGNVSCISPCTFELHCYSTNSDWPYDVMDCSLYLSTWLEYANTLNITTQSNVSRQYLKEQSSWKLVTSHVTSRVATSFEDYPFISYKFILERHMGVYTAVMGPGFMLVVVSLAVLWMNSASPERLYILSVTCLGHYIYLEYIYWHLAYNTRDVPKILLFFRDSLLINVLMLIFTIVLRHTAPRTCSSERLIDRLAVKVASTSFGRVWLHSDHSNNPKQTRPIREEAQTDREHYRPMENGNGDTVTLVVNGVDNASAPAAASDGEQHRTDLVIMFIDRTILLCCMSEEKSTLFLYVWMSLSWKDEFLTWDRAEYGFDKLVVESSELWRPTFVAFHNLKSGNGHSACANHHCEVKQTGMVICVPPCQYEALCVSNTANWPFDSLKCTMFLGAWLENVNQINISRMSNVSTSGIEVSHAEWKIQSSILLHIFLPDNTSYPSLEYVFTLERHIAIYGAILTPGFLMIIIDLAVLWMNSGSTERLYILCAICVGHFTYMEYLYWRVPYHGEAVPKMLLFFRDSLVINVLMLAFTIILRHTASKADGTERLVDKLAFRVASTRFGKAFLQMEEPIGSNAEDTTENANADGGNSNRSRSDHVDGDNVNLVSDAPDSDAPTKRAGYAEQQQPNVVTVFMDRIMFVSAVLCYVFMVFSLLPKENMI